MRLDKFLSVTGTASRKDSARAVRAGAVTVNGIGAKKADMNIDPERDSVLFYGRSVVYRRYTYIMMNKPLGVVSATEDGSDVTVIDLLPDELKRLELFPCGRLDKNTEGLMLLTDNGSLAHYLLSPKRHVSKKYRFSSKFPLTDESKAKLEGGVDIGGYVTKPCKVEILEGGGYITLTEGKYHQIKLMLDAVGNKVTSLERLTFGPLILDPNIKRGEWRYLTDEEIRSIEILAPEGSGNK
jgi:16S rRNA pseudouridine516 synthase